MLIAISFLKSKYDKKSTIQKIQETNCDYIHVDVMDGKFVENKTENLSAYLKDTNKKLDVHLMAEHPMEDIMIYKNLNTEFITIHTEIKDDVLYLLNKIKSYGIKCGIAINPETSIDSIKKYLPIVDQILIMSVNPGKGGQKFMPSVLNKINELNEIKKDYNFIINVDGGINEENISLIKQVNADMIVSGSYICENDDYQKQLDKLKY